MTEQNQSSSAGYVVAPIADEVKSAPSLAVPETGNGEIVPSTTPVLEEHHREFAGFQEEYVRSYITLADAKGAWTFAIASGVLLFLIGTEKTRNVLISSELSWTYAVHLASVLLLTISAYFSFRVVAPRLASKSGEGIVFFDSVASKENAETYVSDVAAHDLAELVEARLQHCFDVSVVCKEKYASLKKAIWFGLPALALTLAAILLNT